MDNKEFLAIHITFHPEPKSQLIKSFSTQTQAEQFIHENNKGNECWVVVQRNNSTYNFIMGIRVPKT